MRDATLTLLKAVELADRGLVVVRCPDYGLRRWLADEVESLVGANAHVRKVEDVDQALADRDHLILLLAEDEAHAVDVLDGSRDLLLDRARPIVLFVTYGADDTQALLARASSLASWAGGLFVDPEALTELDVDAERARFVVDYGKTPAEWLAAWRSDPQIRTPESYVVASKAMDLEAP